MKLRLSSHGIDLTPEMGRHVHRRVHFALGRFAARIRNISVRLTDVNGPRGGIDTCCDIRVDAGFHHPVLIRDRQVNAYAAIDSATDRAARALERVLSAQHRVSTGLRTPFRSPRSTL